MIDGLQLGPDRLTVRWADGAATEYPWLWLRDHSHDPATTHPATGQRQLFTAGVDPTLRGVAARIVDGTVEIDWSDGSGAALVPVDFLAGFRGRSPSVEADQPVLWDRETILDQWPVVACDDVLAGDRGVRSWLDRVAAYGFCIVAGTPSTVEATEALLRRIGYVRETIFGGMWEFQADLAKADTAYTNLELRPHTDGTYSHDAPGLQILHCLEFDGSGGESMMVDGFRIAADLRRDEPELYEVLATVDVPGRYVGDGSHLIASRPVFRHDGSGELVQVSFNNADRAPFLLPNDEMERFYEALRAFEALANDRRLQWRRAISPGEALLFDNWRVLHGRAAYTGHRHLCGGYVNREDYESRRRVLAR